MSRIGDLGEVKIGDVLRVLASGRKSGVLSIAGPSSQAVLHLQKGALVHAEAGRFRGDEAVVDVFGWKAGALSFVPGEPAVKANVTKSLDALILEGVRTGEVMHRMSEVIPSDRVCFQMSGGPEDPDARLALGPAEWKVLRHLDGLRDLRELADVTRLPRPEVTRVLFLLAEAGFLEKVEPPKSLRAQAQGLFGKDSVDIDVKIEAEWRRLNRCINGVHRVEVRSRAGKAGFFSATFRPSLFRDIQLPRTALVALAIREGEDVLVRPAP